MADIYEAINNMRLFDSKKYDSIHDYIIKKFVRPIRNSDTIFNFVMKINPTYTKERLENKFIELGLTDNKEDAKELLEDAVTKQYPYQMLGGSFKFKEKEKNGEKSYKLIRINYL